MSPKQRPGGAARPGPASTSRVPRGAALVGQPAKAPRPTRPGRGATPARGRGGAHARRRGLRIPWPGSVRIPAARRLAALLVAATLVAGLAVMLNGPWLRITSIAWAGSRFVSAADLTPILDPLKGTSLLLLDERTVAAELAAIPGVASASVEPRFPDGVTIQLAERVPAIVWQTSGRRLLVDASGIVFAEIARTGAVPPALAGLPLVDDRRISARSFRPGDRIPDDERTAALTLRNLDPQLAGSAARSFNVAIDQGCGYVISPTTGGWSASLGFHGAGSTGSAGDAPTIEAQVTALRTLFSIHPEGTVGWVDVRNPGKVYWRPSGSGSDTC